MSSAAVPGVRPPELPELVRARDRLTFIYLERSVISRDSNAITATDERGTVHIPAASLGALLLGPGTTVTQQAMVLIAESGSTVVWVGEQGVRYYCHGRSLARSSRLLEAQARLVSTTRSRLRIAKAMYALRFPGEDTSGNTMQQLRGKEGTRVRQAYVENAKRTGVDWRGRSYKVEDFEDADPVNQALSALNVSLYGVVHSVIVALGCSPGLGFIHTGNERSFVFDIADLYKADFTIPLAFDIASQQPDDVGSAARRAVRDAMKRGGFMQRCASDIRQLMLEDTDEAGIEVEFEDELSRDVVQLWGGMNNENVASGRNYQGGQQ
ncbi:type I-E CRISPR-associated endonuclease Cas1 [Leucobacter weissii]|uniref:CRISPR-associated endonuclease Cas1 n=1 Tax=Leucobacter weissii TaxID=1983706 RepID=A0A939MKX5_9MICO|nr:type I-E CRISPR-associated endonuclease Cas1e [Leucobacter weissii]MBO1900532.1 type I-E CRISPR-associated endonuclease Cas1 [Leucobacter weissii]